MWRVWVWLFFWKIGDMISTLYAAQRFGWGMELNWIANLGSILFGHWFYLFYTVALVPSVVILSYFLWRKGYYTVIEVMCLALPGVVIGNFLGLYGFIYTGFLVHVVTGLTVLVYCVGQSYDNYRKQGVNVWESRWI